MEFQELTPQEMEQVNGGGLLGGGLLGGLLGSNCNNSCNDSCGSGGIDVKVKLSIGICL